MSVGVKLIDGDGGTTFYVEHSAALGDVRARAANVHNVLPGRLKVLHRGRVLTADNITLTRYGVRDGDTLHVVRARSTGPRLGQRITASQPMIVPPPIVPHDIVCVFETVLVRILGDDSNVRWVLRTSPIREATPDQSAASSANAAESPPGRIDFPFILTVQLNRRSTDEPDEADFVAVDRLRHCLRLIRAVYHQIYHIEHDILPTSAGDSGSGGDVPMRAESDTPPPLLQQSDDSNAGRAGQQRRTPRDNWRDRPRDYVDASAACDRAEQHVDAAAPHDTFDRLQLVRHHSQTIDRRQSYELVSSAVNRVLSHCADFGQRVHSVAKSDATTQSAYRHLMHDVAHLTHAFSDVSLTPAAADGAQCELMPKNMPHRRDCVDSVILHVCFDREDLALQAGRIAPLHQAGAQHQPQPQPQHGGNNANGGGQRALAPLAQQPLMTHTAMPDGTHRVNIDADVLTNVTLDVTRRIMQSMGGQQPQQPQQQHNAATGGGQAPVQRQGVPVPVPVPTAVPTAGGQAHEHAAAPPANGPTAGNRPHGAFGNVTFRQGPTIIVGPDGRTRHIAPPQGGGATLPMAPNYQARLPMPPMAFAGMRQPMGQPSMLRGQPRVFAFRMPIGAAPVTRAQGVRMPFRPPMQAPVGRQAAPSGGTLHGGPPPMPAAHNGGAGADTPQHARAQALAALPPAEQHAHPIHVAPVPVYGLASMDITGAPGDAAGRHAIFVGRGPYVTTPLFTTDPYLPCSSAAADCRPTADATDLFDWSSEVSLRGRAELHRVASSAAEMLVPCLVKVDTRPPSERYAGHSFYALAPAHAAFGRLPPAAGHARHYGHTAAAAAAAHNATAANVASAAGNTQHNTANASPQWTGTGSATVGGTGSGRSAPPSQSAADAGAGAAAAAGRGNGVTRRAAPPCNNTAKRAKSERAGAAQCASGSASATATAASTATYSYNDIETMLPQHYAEVVIADSTSSRNRRTDNAAAFSRAYVALSRWQRPRPHCPVHSGEPAGSSSAAATQRSAPMDTQMGQQRVHLPTVLVAAAAHAAVHSTVTGERVDDAMQHAARQDAARSAHRDFMSHLAAHSHT